MRDCLDEIGLALAGRAELVPAEELAQPEPLHVSAPTNGNGGNGSGAASVPHSNGSTIVATRVEQPRPSVAHALHGAADRVIRCLALNDFGELASTEAESDDALEGARESLSRYHMLSAEERTKTADTLAVAVDLLVPLQDQVILRLVQAIQVTRLDDE